jgi:hypothetical protein
LLGRRSAVAIACRAGSNEKVMFVPVGEEATCQRLPVSNLLLMPILVECVRFVEASIPRIFPVSGQPETCVSANIQGSLPDNGYPLIPQKAMCSWLLSRPFLLEPPFFCIPCRGFEFDPFIYSYQISLLIIFSSMLNNLEKGSFMGSEALGVINKYSHHHSSVRCSSNCRLKLSG